MNSNTENLKSNTNAIINYPTEEKNTETKTEENENPISYEIVKKDKSKLKKIIIILSVILVLLLCLFSTVFALLNIGNTTIATGTSIDGIDVSKMSIEEAKSKLQEYYDIEKTKTYILKYQDYEISITPEQIELLFNIDKAVKDAYNIGKSENILVNNYELIYTKLFNTNVDIEISFNEEALDKLISDINLKLPGALKEPTYCIENEQVIISNGKKGVVVQEDILKNILLDNIKNSNQNDIEIPVKEVEPSKIDIDKIHSEIYTEPKDAYYTKDPFEIYPHVVGVDFAISLDEAKKMISEPKDEYKIDLKYTTPKVTTNKIGTEAFPDLLSHYSTTYITSKVNRTTNLKLAAAKIDGYVLMPGETFSYNKVVGKRTVEAGYKEAGVYSGGREVDGLGGGICQISSVLYNVALLSNMEIVERHNHQFLPGYVPAGRDATVVYGSLDFKFKNNRNYPIKITAYVGNGVAKMSIYGVKEDSDYEVVLSTTITQTLYPKTIYENNSSLASGTEKVVQYGKNGCRSIAYKTLKKNGKTVSTTVLSRDTYDAMSKIVQRGTKGSNVVVQSKPTNNEDKNTNTSNKNQNTIENNTNTTNTTENTTIENAVEE